MADSYAGYMTPLASVIPARARFWAGWAMAFIGLAVATAVLIPFRSHIAVATSALVLVVPVVLGVAVGGFPVAPVGVAAGFLTFDYFFIPPYHRFQVGAGEHWVSLGVYAAVALMVSAVVAQAQRARSHAEAREGESQAFFDLSHAMAAAGDIDADLRRIVTQARPVLGVDTVEVLVADGEADDGVLVLAGDGAPLAPASRQQSLAVALGLVPEQVDGQSRSVVIRSSNGPIGALVAAGGVLTGEGERALAMFANHTALAIERSRLAEEATRTRLLEEVNRLRSALVGSVSHDLRTPLASIKASVSDLVDPTVVLGAEDRRTLLSTIDEETDRLTRFVSNLLDMTRIEAGALELHRAATPLDELVGAVSERMSRLLAPHPVRVLIDDELPLVDIDYMLIEQVLANLLENAGRHSPPGSIIAIVATQLVQHWVEMRVIDHGPGIPEAERARVFEQFYRFRGDGSRLPGVGLGLAICQGIMAAHNGRIWVEATPGGGATFVVRLPVADLHRKAHSPAIPGPA